jgi:hypothetical protein
MSSRIHYHQIKKNYESASKSVIRMRGHFDFYPISLDKRDYALFKSFSKFRVILAANVAFHICHVFYSLNYNSRH